MSSEPHDPSDDSPRPLVRVMLALQFGGAAVMLLVCWLEWRTGVISPWDRWLLPSVAVVIAASAALGQVHPAWEGELRLVTVSAFNLYLGFSLLATLEIGPQTSQWYQTITTLLWMPLGYGCAFVFLRPRLALLVSGVTACGVFGPLLLWDLQDRLPAWTHENGPLLPVAGLAQAMYVVLLMAFVHRRSSNERARVHMRTMHELARTDMLTTLPNRRAMTETLSASIGALRGTGRPFAVVLVDLDHFKQVNDRHGHDAGDAVLHATGDAMRASLRAGDTLARWGGEEFLMCAPGAGPAQLQELGERLRRAVQQVNVIDGAAVTVSVGATACAPGDDLRSLIRRADIALYRAKTQGRDRVECELAEAG